MSPVATPAKDKPLIRTFRPNEFFRVSVKPSTTMHVPARIRLIPIILDPWVSIMLSSARMHTVRLLHLALFFISSFPFSANRFVE